MKVFIMTDLEGATGVAGYWEDFNPGGRLHEEARRMLTSDVNAAIEGALNAGVDEVVVLDGHGAAFSILLEQLHPSAKLIRGRRILEMEGLDESFDAVLAVGAHAKAGAPLALLCHTLSHTSIHEIRVNGRVVGEVGLWALIAGSLGVPLAMVAGDAAAVAEAEELIRNVEGVAVKHATSMYAAKCLHPSLTYKLISIAAQRAVKKSIEGAFKPLSVEKTVEMEVVYTTPAAAESVARRKGVRRVDGRTVSYIGETVTECMNMLL
ncbi:MAG: M55 family metallopeptidase [Thermofilaceae archaeon]|nr:M55 family metallopeptidase [Thermofilaceae archaeon]MCX8180917.1 M55 family metallopeptidase [Thermofilaceae archaeon]MDW8003482.1 M55 family metallopeptidase [Thermofilaceae archaeon]